MSRNSSHALHITANRVTSPGYKSGRDDGVHHDFAERRRQMELCDVRESGRVNSGAESDRELMRYEANVRRAGCRGRFSIR